MISASLGSSLGWDIAAWASRRFPPGGLCAAIVGFRGLLSVGPLRTLAALSVGPRGVGIAAWAPGGPRALLSVGLCGVVFSLRALGSSPEGRPKFASRAPFSLPPFSLHSFWPISHCHIVYLLPAVPREGLCPSSSLGSLVSFYSLTLNIMLRSGPTLHLPCGDDQV